MSDSSKLYLLEPLKQLLVVGKLLLVDLDLPHQVLLHIVVLLLLLLASDQGTTQKQVLTVLVVKLDLDVLQVQSGLFHFCLLPRLEKFCFNALNL